MTNSQEATLAELSLQDERDITAVIMRFATAVDNKDWNLLRDCFATVIDIDYRPAFRSQDIDELAQMMDEQHRGFGKTLHRNTNIVISSSPGGAKSRTYVNGIFMYPDGGMAMEAEGYYDDFFVRENGSWKLSNRLFVAVRKRRAAAEGEHVPFTS